MLRRPAPRGAGAVVVRPDDLVEEVFATEERVQRHLRVVGLAVVEVQVEGALRIQQPPGLLEPRLEKSPSSRRSVSSYRESAPRTVS